MTVEDLAEAKRRGSGGGRGKKPQRDGVIAAGLRAELFTHDGETFATVSVLQHRETYRLRSRAFRRWMASEFYAEAGTVPGGQAIEDAIRVLDAEAFRQNRSWIPAIRVAEHEGLIYLDLADAEWRVVEIGAKGWCVRAAEDVPVRFIRPIGMRPLPFPEAGGSIADISNFVNVNSDDLPLVFGWLVAALRPTGPFPIAVLIGESGAAKTSTARVLRSLVDPNAALLRSPPREERDLLVAAKNSWVVGLDNISSVSDWLSDGICRISTGGGYGARQLHTDTDEIIFSATRPFILNGIGEIAGRSDLADRSIVLHLPPIADSERRSDREFWRSFHLEHPFMLGSLLGAVSVALSRASHVNLEAMPRMADFAQWAVAAEPAWAIKYGNVSEPIESQFLARYTDNIAGLVDASIENDAVASAVRGLAVDTSETLAFMPDGSEFYGWIGTPTALFEILRDRVGDRIASSPRSFPQAANALSARLRRAGRPLRAIGVFVEIERFHKDRGRLVKIYTDGR